MSFSLEEPSYLGASPRRLLPTTSLDHADLVAPMAALDFSDAEEERESLVDGFEEGRGVKVPISSAEEKAFPDSDSVEAKSREEPPQIIVDNSTTANVSTILTGCSVATVSTTPTGCSAANVSTTPTVCSVAHSTSDQSKRPPSPGGKKKAAGTVVASRYMSEAAKRPKPSPPQVRNNNSRSVPSKSQTLVRTATPKTKPSTPTSKASTRNATPKAPSPSKQNLQARSASTTTPTSSHRSNGVSDHDLYLASVIMGNTAKILAVELEEKREVYLKAATAVLTHGTVAIVQLAGKNNENVERLYRVQCEMKASSLDAITRETWLSESKINQAMERLGELEGALRAKGHELGASESLLLPMSDDSSGQAAIAAKIVARLRAQVDSFRSLEIALPEEIRRETKKLAESLSEFDGEVNVTVGQMDGCCRHLKKCLDVLVDYVFKVRHQSLPEGSQRA